jgi:hypothetical protein
MQVSDDNIKHIVKSYDVGPINTLVDLNLDLVNFSADFVASAEKDDGEFQLAVVDQTAIDNGEIAFRDVKGKIGATVKWDKNAFKNHYIALKSKTEQKIKVDINLKELPKTRASDEQSGHSADGNPEGHREDNLDKSHTAPPVVPHHDMPNCSQKQSIFSKTWFKVFLVASALFIVVLWYKKNCSTAQPGVQPRGSNPRYESPMAQNVMNSANMNMSGGSFPINRYSRLF